MDGPAQSATLGGVLKLLLAVVLVSIASCARSHPVTDAAPQFPAVAAGPGATLTVDPARRHQTFHGFGASGAWWHTFVGNFPIEEQRALLRMLYAPEGAHLAVFRYNLPAGSGPDVTDAMRATNNIEVEPLKFDLSRDAKAITLLREARALGVEKFVLFSNSPPARLTRNGKTSGGENGGSNLRRGAEREFATYLVLLSEQIKRELKLPDVSLSPINEPQWKWGEKGRAQEGCHYTPAEAAEMIRATIDVVLERGSPLTVEAPESGAWDGSMNYAELLFADPVINAHLKEFALHSYWTNRETKVKVAAEFRSRFPDKKLAMTEFCEMKWGHDLTIEGGLHLAEVIHDDLTVGDVVTWQWWLAIAPGGYRDGLIYAHPQTRKVEPTKRWGVIGQYSRHARPGSVRVHAEALDPRLKVTAFVSPDGRELATIVVNMTKDPVPAVLPTVPTGATFTDATHDLAPLPVPSREITFAPQSVTSVVWKK